MGWWPFGKSEHDCKKHGHRYTQRYDELPDPRYSSQVLADAVRFPSSHCGHVHIVRLYVRDICEFCGDVIDRTEGEHPLKALARQAK